MPGKHRLPRFECHGDGSRAFSRGGKEPEIARSGGNSPGQPWLGISGGGQAPQETVAVRREESGDGRHAAHEYFLLMEESRQDTLLGNKVQQAIDLLTYSTQPRTLSSIAGGT